MLAPLVKELIRRVEAHLTTTESAGAERVYQDAIIVDSIVKEQSLKIESLSLVARRSRASESALCVVVEDREDVIDAQREKLEGAQATFDGLAAANLRFVKDLKGALERLSKAEAKLRAYGDIEGAYYRVSKRLDVAKKQLKLVREQRDEIKAQLAKRQKFDESHIPAVLDAIELLGGNVNTGDLSQISEVAREYKTRADQISREYRTQNESLQIIGKILGIRAGERVDQTHYHVEQLKQAYDAAYSAGQKTAEGYDRLREAVRHVYYACRWINDRPLENPTKGWAILRDAAGFEKGHSPYDPEVTVGSVEMWYKGYRFYFNPTSGRYTLAGYTFENTDRIKERIDFWLNDSKGRHPIYSTKSGAINQQ